MEEEWKEIRHFPDYMISNFGAVYNKRTEREVMASANNFGTVRVNLVAPDGSRHTRSVAVLVAEAFLRKPTRKCTQVMMLDGNLSHVVSSNLAWRTVSYAYEYVRQLKLQQPINYLNLRVRDVTTGEEYGSIVEAGMTLGLLFKDIWRSTYTGAAIFPYGSIFEVVGPRV